MRLVITGVDSASISIYLTLWPPDSKSSVIPTKPAQAASPASPLKSATIIEIISNNGLKSEKSTLLNSLI